MCNIPEDLNHYLCVCQKFDIERIELEEKVEEILHRANANRIGNIDMTVLTGMVDDICREAQHNLVGALINSLEAQRGFNLKYFNTHLNPSYVPVLHEYKAH